MAIDPTDRAFYLRRADSYHTALFVIGVLLVVQVTAFANLVGSSSGDAGGFVCQVTTLAGRLTVYGALAMFAAAYHLAIVWTARMEARWRARAGVDSAGVDDGGLTNQLAFAIMAINVVTTLMAMGLFGAGQVVQQCG